jgi:hypothetical protein
VELLESLVPQIEIETLNATVETLLANKDKTGREIALACLMPWLNGESRELVQRQVISAMRQQCNRWQRAGCHPEWRHQPELLIALAPYLTEEMIEQATRIVMTIDDMDRQISVLRELLPFVKDDTSLLKYIQIAILERLEDFKDQSRSDLLHWLAHQNCAALSALSPEILRVVASNIYEICRKWHWL